MTEHSTASAETVRLARELVSAALSEGANAESEHGNVGAYERAQVKTAKCWSALLAHIAELSRDSARLDWLQSWTRGDQGICPPGNHGGNDKNWLIYHEDDSRGDRIAGRWCVEEEGATLREALDKAMAAPEERAE